MVAGFALVVRALRPRWVMLTLVGVAYFPFMFAVLEISAWMVSPILARIHCSGDGPPGVVGLNQSRPGHQYFRSKIGLVYQSQIASR